MNIGVREIYTRPITIINVKNWIKSNSISQNQLII